ncbi:MAG: cupin domain-containing protein [Candidatus Uhrbacteria bacterium]
MSYNTNIIRDTNENNFFRRVLFTGAKSQLVVMDIKSGEDIGEETHAHVEQILFFLSGEGKAMLDGVETPVVAGDVYVVTPGTRHNFINTGSVSMKVYTVYVPPNHIDGTIHETKAAAIADVADEEFGHKVE